MRRGLYAIFDLDVLARANRDPVAFATRVLAAGPLAAAQLRAKSAGPREALAVARALAPLCARADTPFFVNDRPDLAVLADAPGVHVGGDDLPVDAVLRFAPTLRVGLSTHTLDELAAGLSTRANYLAFGPVFATGTKPDAAPTTGTAALAEAARRAAPHGRPLVAIGGITLDLAPHIRDAGATAGAVISALLVPDAHLTSHAKALHRALGGD
jgi:thiamine-phosphate pyrophosphorylase